MQYSFGAEPSKQDPRTIVHEPAMAVVYDTGGAAYEPNEIEHQHKVGICTAISIVQSQQKANGKKYSSDFQYLLQKKFYDGAWYEGSSLLSALKVAKKYGFLPANLWTHTTEADRELPYTEYAQKLIAIPDSEVQRLIGLCVDKIKGYAQVDVNNPVAIARAITESKSGIYCRFSVDLHWWTSPISPLQAPTPPNTITGHAIIMNMFDYTPDTQQTVTNTWGTEWANHGTADVKWSGYRPTEAWVVVDKEYFLKDLKLGMTDPDVKRLQQFLNGNGFQLATSGAGSPGNETEYFGGLTQKALIKFQTANNISPAVGYFGIITRTRVNSML